MREYVHSTRHMKKIEEILAECGLPGRRFAYQSQFISAMLMPGEEPLAGCIGHQYAPPPEHDFPRLILATNVRILAIISNTDIDDMMPTLSSGHPYNLINEIYFYENNHGDAELRLRYRNNRRVVIYRNIVSALESTVNAIDQLNFGINCYKVSVPMEEAFSWKERIIHRSSRCRKALHRAVASPTLTTLLNILLAIAVITQAIALIKQ